MSFLNTQPSTLEDPAELEIWMSFRVDDPRARLAALRELARGETPLVIGTPRGETFVATLWAPDIERERLHLRVEPCDADPVAVAAAGPMWAAAYLGTDKLQFLLHHVVLEETGEGQWRFESNTPFEMYRMPRRREVRLRRAIGKAPRARLHGLQGHMQGIAVIVLDISRSGCALFLPPDWPQMEVGERIDQVEFELDEDVFVFTDLVVRNVQRAPRGSQRLGCRFARMPQAGHTALERWLDSGRARHIKLSLSFD